MAVCPSVVRARVLRATRLDDCGAPVVGDNSVVTSKGFTTIGLSPQYEDAEEIIVKNANDELCINDKGSPQLTGIEVEMEFCNVDPQLLTLITGDPLVLDGLTVPGPVGFRIREGIVYGRFALEVWSNISGQNCAPGQGKNYWYHLLPLLSNAMWGDVTFENAAVSFTVTGTTLPGSNWGVGPFDVVPTGATAVPGPLLTAIDPADHYHGQQTSVAPPEVVCGFQELEAPSATGFAAGKVLAAA